MLGVLPTWVTDTGAVVGILAAATVVIAAVAGFVVWLVRKIVRPDLERIERRIDSHMGEEERQIDRIAIALDMIANAVHVRIPSIRVSGGADEGDDSP